jgi:signal transduction histidine kinase
MRRRLLIGTVAIAVMCVVILGVPLILLARHEVWASARDRLNEQAASAAVDVEDRVELNRPLDLGSLQKLMPHRSLTVITPTGRVVTAAGAAIDHALTARAVAADYTIIVRAPEGPVVARAREITALLLALGAAAIAAAVALALWQSRRLAAPVAQLLARADDLGRGDFTGPALVSGIPEIDAVAHVLDRSARQIGSLVELQRDFAADAAHQLRTPLTSVALHIDEMAVAGGDAVKEEAEEALGQVERLNRVITAFLARARGDAAPPEAVDISALVADSCSPYARLLRRADRRLHTAITPGISVRVRSDHVLAALGCLLDNALVHGAGMVSVSTRRHDRTVDVVVTDEGPGVPADLRDSVFERLISGARSSGIGLGLARALATTEGGTLRLEPPATFVLTLPLDEPAGPASSA